MGTTQKTHASGRETADEADEADEADGASVCGQPHTKTISRCPLSPPCPLCPRLFPRQSLPVPGCHHRGRGQEKTEMPFRITPRLRPPASGLKRRVPPAQRSQGDLRTCSLTTLRTGSLAALRNRLQGKQRQATPYGTHGGTRVGRGGTGGRAYRSSWISVRIRGCHSPRSRLFSS